MKIICNAQYAALTCAFISTEETRYYLNGIFIEPAESLPGVFIVATDGHRLGTFYDSKGAAEEGAIVCLPKNELVKLAKNQDGLLHIDTETGMAEHCVPSRPEHKFIVKIVDGKFPDWRRVIPQFDTLDKVQPVAGLSFNPQYMADFKLRGHAGAIRVMPTDAEGTAPFLIHAANMPDFLGVLMPMRFGGGHITHPLAVKPVKKEVEAKPAGSTGKSESVEMAAASF